MSTDQFVCGTCGEVHSGPLLSFAAPAPDVWEPEMAEDESCLLDSDLCVVRGEHFFLRGLIEVPIWETGELFTWSMWVSLSRPSFTREPTTHPLAIEQRLGISMARIAEIAAFHLHTL